MSSTRYWSPLLKAGGLIKEEEEEALSRENGEDKNQKTQVDLEEIKAVHAPSATWQ